MGDLLNHIGKLFAVVHFCTLINMKDHFFESMLSLFGVFCGQTLNAQVLPQNRSVDWTLAGMQEEGCTISKYDLRYSKFWRCWGWSSSQ